MKENKRVVLHQHICSRLTKTYRDKNSDYGNSFVKVREEFPNAILIRLSDKLNRLKTFRYCNYSKDGFGNEITVIKPCYLDEGTRSYLIWARACEAAEKHYFWMLEYGCTPQEARAVLPNSLKTEIIMTANLREWRHFLKVRTAKNAHPQIRELAVPLLRELQELLPTIFDDIVL